MKKCLPLFFLMLVHITSTAADKDSTIQYAVPDSVKAVLFLTDITVESVFSKKEVSGGIKTSLASLSLVSARKEKKVVFTFPEAAVPVASGQAVRTNKKGRMEWDYQWTPNHSYKLMLAVAPDSAANFTLYTGYIWLPAEKTWKLIGCSKISGQWTTIKEPASFFTAEKKKSLTATISNTWCQRSNGSWRRLDEGTSPIPIITLASHADSLQQMQVEKSEIEKAIAAGETDVKENKEGVYYKIYSEGTGRQVAVTDTVTVFYKGYLFSNGQVFDQTKEKPAVFPLNRLVKGWQIAVPLLRVGGKLKCVIPSALAYAIRTRAAKIPPNSTLVFEIEVVDAKAAVLH